MMSESRVMRQSSPAFDAQRIRECFERDGWALVRGLLAPREVEGLRLAVDALTAKGAALVSDAEIDGARYQVQSASGRIREAAIRPGVLWRKGSFGTQSANGSRFVEAMMTVVATLKQQHRTVLVYMTEACQAAYTGTPAPSLLPCGPETQAELPAVA